MARQSYFYLTLLSSLLLLMSSVSEAGRAPTGGLRITSPVNGAAVEPGQPFTVVVEPEAGVTPAFVALVSPNIVELKREPPFTFSVSFPSDAPLGPEIVVADGRDAKKRPLRAKVTLNIETATPVRTIRVRSTTVGRAPEVSLIAGLLERRLRVEGDFTDGTTRNISKSREITPRRSSMKMRSETT